MQAVLLNPQSKRMLQNAGKMAVQAIGRSRGRRADQGRWYLGQKLGAPPQRGGQWKGRRGKRIQQAAQLGQTITTSVIANAGQFQKNLQSSKRELKLGSEKIDQLKITTTEFVSGDYGLLFSASINPADPGVFPSLSAVANQYQQFRCNSLKFTFQPCATTNTPGNIYLGFVPNCAQKDPTSTADILAMLGGVKGPFYGAATTAIVPSEAIQKAFAVQQVTKNATAVDTTQMSPGRLFVGFDGAGVETDYNNKSTVVGTLTCTYSFTFTTPHLVQGSNSASGVHLYVGDSRYPVFDEDNLDEGYLCFKDHDSAIGVYKPRIPGAEHLVVYKGEVSADTHSLEVSTSFDALTWTVVPPLDNMTNLLESMAMWIIPPTSFVKFDFGSKKDITYSRLAVASLPTQP